MKNIKKILIAVVLVTVLVVSAVMLVACNKDAVKVIEYKLTDEEYAFGVQKSNTELLNKINTALAEIKEDGTVDAIMQKYFNGEEVMGYESPAKDSTKKQLVVATNAAFEPFEYKTGNKFCGIDIEMMKAIADKLEMELVIEDMDFDSVVTAVQQGLADVAAAGLTVTADRSQKIAFTDTYYNASQMLVVNKDDTTFDDCKSAEDVINVLKGLSNVKAGYQNGTTGQYFIQGSDDYEGFANITGKGYTNAGLAVKDMTNGNINFVVVDEMPAKSITKKMNK